MAVTRFTIPDLTDTDYEASVVRALDRVGQVSNGELTELTAHSPVAAITEGMVYLLGELRHSINQVPFATLIRLLDAYGAGVGTGAAAVGSVEVTLTAPTATGFTIPAGWQLTGGTLTYKTTGPMVFSTGSVASSAPVECLTLGAAGNLPAGALNALAAGSVVYANIASIRNPDPLAGGADPETELEAIYRAAEFLHYRDVVVTARDYELVAQSVLGNGSRAIAVPNLGADRTTIERGQVHVFTLTPGGTAPTTAELVRVQQTLEPLVLAGTLVHVSAAPVLYVSAKVIARISVSAVPDTIFEEVVSRVKDYFDPRNWQRGAVMYKEVEYLVRQVNGVEYVQGAYVWADSEFPETPPPAYTMYATNIQLPTPYTLPFLASFDLDLLTDFNTYQYAFSTGTLEVEPVVTP